jgi:hypothetical protein
MLAMIWFDSRSPNCSGASSRGIAPGTEIINDPLLPDDTSFPVRTTICYRRDARFSDGLPVIITFALLREQID